MQLDTIIQTLLSAAAFLKKPIADAAGHSIKELFDTACHYLKRKFGEHSDGAKVLDLAVEKPESALRKAVLVEEAGAAGLAGDADLMRLAEKIASLLPVMSEPSGHSVQVSGRQNKVVVAGRDVIQAERVVRRSAIAPNEAHITAAQRKRIRALIGELATRRAGEDGRPNFAAGHTMLQRKFGVPSYALIPRERFAEAIRFLIRCCVIQRLRTQRCLSGDAK